MTVAKSAVTGTFGGYSMVLEPRSYVFCEVSQAGWRETGPAPADGECAAIAAAEGVADGGLAVTLSPLTNRTGLDFGNHRGVIVSGVKFNDVNANGVQDGPTELGLADWTIRAYEDDGDGVLRADEVTVAKSAVTGTFGGYSMVLEPWSYVFCEVSQAGWRETRPVPADGECAAIAPVEGVADGGLGVTLSPLTSRTGLDFGNHHGVIVSGVKFNDVNVNGPQDAGELGLEGWTIRAYADAANPIGSLGAGDTTLAKSAVTGVGGAYSMLLEPGSYVLCEVSQTGWRETRPAPLGNECGNDIADVADGGIAVTLLPLTNHTGLDFGNHHGVIVSGVKFNDVNANGVQDGPTEVGLVGWTIRAYADASPIGTLGVGDITLKNSAVTGVGGAYSMLLEPGSYVLCEVAQANWRETRPAPAGNQCGDTILGVADGGLAVTLLPLTNRTGLDFGNTAIPVVQPNNLVVTKEQRNITLGETAWNSAAAPPMGLAALPPADLGDTIEYRITVRNESTTTAAGNVTVTDSLDPDMQWQDFKGNRYSPLPLPGQACSAGQNMVCTLGTMLPGQPGC